MSDKIQIALSETEWGRIALHVMTLCVTGHFRFHLAGIGREIRRLA